MNKLKAGHAAKAAFAAILFVGACRGASAADALYADIPPDLAKAAQAYDDAQLQGNGAVLQRLLADDYRLINGGALVESKAQFIKDSTDPNFKLLPFKVQEPIHVMWKDGAVLGGKVDLHWVDHGKSGSQRVRFADIWAMHNNSWRVAYTQVTRLPEK